MKVPMLYPAPNKRFSCYALMATGNKYQITASQGTQTTNHFRFLDQLVFCGSLVLWDVGMVGDVIKEFGLSFRAQMYC